MSEGLGVYHRGSVGSELNGNFSPVGLHTHSPSHFNLSGPYSSRLQNEKPDEILSSSTFFTWALIYIYLGSSLREI